MTKQEHIDGVKQAQEEHKSWIMDNQKTHLGMVTSQVDRMSEALENQTNISLIHEKDRIKRDKLKRRGDIWLHFTDIVNTGILTHRSEVCDYADNMLIEYDKRFHI